MSQCLETSVIKEGDGFFISGHWLHTQTKHPQFPGFFNRVIQQLLSDSPASMLCRNNDGFHLRLLVILDQGHKPDDIFSGSGNPDSFRTHAGKMLVKLKSRVVSSNRGIIVNVPVLLCMKFLFFCECFLFATNKTNKIEQKKIII